MKAAVIGLGRVGFDFGTEKGRLQPASHAHCYVQLLDAENVALVDNDTHKLEQAHEYFEFKTKVYDSIHYMLENFKPDIVSICVPTPIHAAIVEAVARSESVKNIFLEKPIAQSLSEADQILRACKGKQLSVNFSRRWSKTYQRINTRNAHTLIGVHPGPVIRTGSHMINLFNWLANKRQNVKWDNVEVQAFGPMKLAEYMSETEDANFNGFINYGDTTATLIGNTVTPSKTVVFELTVIGADEVTKVTDNGLRLQLFERRSSKRYTGLDEYQRTFLKEEDTENPLLNAIVQQLQTPDINMCSGMDARRDLHVALALHYSATHGNRVVKLSELPYDYTVRSY